MNRSQILDCTLRDGAYLLDKKFGDNNINGIVHGLVEAKIDWIEMGFLQNEGFEEGKTVFLNSVDAEKYIPAIRGNSHFTVFADYSRYSIENLDEFTGHSFDAVRACFLKKERHDVLAFCREIKRKGYKLFIQPVDALGYNDAELIELINDINKIKPYCFSIVDTYGSMYEDDLLRVFNLIDRNLMPDCQIGFHSHNNLQMSSALTQAFLKLSYGRRGVVADSTIAGMGRGAGNTPTELIVQYMVSKLGYHYDLDTILDLIDTFIDNIRTKCSWGYSTPFFIAGAYSAHVNNISYLLQKNSIRSKDIRYILNKIGEMQRKRYNYDLLESTYLQYLESDIDDSKAIRQLHDELAGRCVVIIAPGNSARTQSDIICKYVEEHNAIAISINFFPEKLKPDYIYMNNVKRYNSKKELFDRASVKKIFTSNIMREITGGEYIVSFNRLIKCGWEHTDNSTIMLMRLLNQLEVNTISIAGFDGYDYITDAAYNYAVQEMELASLKENAASVNGEIADMLLDFIETKRSSTVVEFVTRSRFEKVLKP